MQQACEGIVCDPTTTCVSGVCKSATLDSTQCEGAGCDESALGSPWRRRRATRRSDRRDASRTTRPHRCEAPATRPSKRRRPGVRSRRAPGGLAVADAGVLPDRPANQSPLVGPSSTPAHLWQYMAGSITATGRGRRRHRVCRDDRPRRGVGPADGGARLDLRSRAATRRSTRRRPPSPPTTPSAFPRSGSSARTRSSGSTRRSWGARRRHSRTRRHHDHRRRHAVLHGHLGDAAKPNLSIAVRAINVISVSMMVVSAGRRVKRKAPVTLCESRSA